jgi:hypothetical protein
MAAKKTAKTIPKSASKKVVATPKPAAKKAAKKAAVKKADPARAAVKAPATAKKAPATAKKAPATAKKAPAKKTAAKPSLDAVARAAYLNYRNRVEKGLPGDSHGDWLEAERQQSELGC